MLTGSHNGSIETDIYRRVEVITGAVRRRRWTAAEKARIVAESFEGRLSVSEVARRHGVAGSLLFAWRKQVRDGTFATSSAGAGGFVPLAVDDGRSIPVTPEAVIEVAAGEVVVRLPASADEETLRRVIRAMRAA